MLSLPSLSSRYRVNWLIELFSSYSIELSASSISVCNSRLIDSPSHNTYFVANCPTPFYGLHFRGLGYYRRVGLVCLGLYSVRASSCSVLRLALMVSYTVVLLAYETLDLLGMFFLNLCATCEWVIFLEEDSWF